MSKPLPKRGFKWKLALPTEEDIMVKNEDAEEGWILEVDLEYPAELHKEHNAYPLAPEKKAVNEEMLSPYQKRLLAGFGQRPPKIKKLLLTLKDKESYVGALRRSTTGTCSST